MKFDMKHMKTACDFLLMIPTSTTTLGQKTGIWMTMRPETVLARMTLLMAEEEMVFT